METINKSPPQPSALTGLRERAADGEQIELVGDALWIYYVGGFGRSMLTPTLLDRLVGSPVTARNWCTTVQLAKLVGAEAHRDGQPGSGSSV